MRILNFPWHKHLTCPSSFLLCFQNLGREFEKLDRVFEMLGQKYVLYHGPCYPSQLWKKLKFELFFFMHNTGTSENPIFEVGGYFHIFAVFITNICDALRDFHIFAVFITNICYALRDLVPLVQLKKREKHPWRSVNFTKVAG